MRLSIKQFINRYILTESLPLNYRILNMAMVLGLFAGLVSAAARIYEGMPPITLVGMALIVVSVIVLFLVSNYFNLFKVGTNITLLALSNALYPFIFFTNGGLYSGMAAYFVMTIFLILLLSEGRLRVVFLLTHAAIVLFCYLLAVQTNTLIPIVPTTPLQHMVDSLQSIFVSGLFCGAISAFVQSMYRRERSKAERALQDAERARSEAEFSASAKSEFLSNMSHEMRTPMNAIIGMTKLAQQEGDEEKVRYYLGRIEDAGTHLLGVINDVLDMSKIDAGKLELASAAFTLEALLQRANTIMSFRIKDKNLQYLQSVDEDAPQLLYGDDQRLAQVITNLLSNAVKFTPEGGCVSLAVQLEGRDTTAAGERRECTARKKVLEVIGSVTLRISVKDTGIGISEADQKKLFASFVQADSSTSREYGGTGLGLAISKRIVELMDGSIGIESKPNEGATFSFTVKLLEVRAAAGEEGSSQKAAAISSPQVPAPGKVQDARQKRILVAEDVEVNREIVLALLETLGYNQVDCVENGLQAVELFEAAPESYALVLMDMQMPEMDGLEATRRMRALPGAAAAQLPIVAMTANVFQDDIDACIEAGMNDHLGKPLDFGKVEEMLARYVG